MVLLVLLRKYVPALSVIACVASSSALGQTLVSKTTIVDNIEHYYWLLTTSEPGPYNQVGVHRVVQVKNNHPVPSPNGVFFVHGTESNFNIDFMGASSSPYSVAVYLAQQGIDVWGIDLAWTLVPLSETNFAFMESWGMQHDVDEVREAMHFARNTRKNTGSGEGRLALLGFSMGSSIGYGVVNEETQLQCSDRHVKGFISVDEVFTSNNHGEISGSCSQEALYQSFGISKGLYVDNSGSFVPPLAIAAETAPNAISPYVPPYTNLQYLYVSAAAPWEQSAFYPRWSHYLAGVFGQGGINTIPLGFHWTDVARYETELASVPPYEPIQLESDFYAITCGDGPVELSNHLAQIRVPVFYLGAAGGNGAFGLYTLSQLGSSDISSSIISFYPAGQYRVDYGHNDLFDADNARDVVWSKILQWMQNHMGDSTCP